MLALLSKAWRPLLIPLAALAFFLGAWLFFYRGGYDPPPVVNVPFEQIGVPSSVFGSFDETPAVQPGLLLLDDAHGNDFTRQEVTALISRVSDRGYTVVFLGNAPGRFTGTFAASLEEMLRGADSLAVIGPRDPYTDEEVDLIERFVEKGGKLLLIEDPTRGGEINSLARSFGVTFEPDYLYNQVENDINFRNIYVRDFRGDQITRNLDQIALYTAGSISSAGEGLALTDGNTRSSIVEGGAGFFPLARGIDPRVVAVADLSFMIPPQDAILDNGRLISNIADFLTTSERTFDLADYPSFFGEEVDILLGRASLFDLGTRVKSTLSAFQLESEIQGVEDLGRDTVYLGLYADASDVVQYLSVAGVHLDDTLRTPFTADIVKDGTALLVLHRTQDRHVLVVLADSEPSLSDVIGRLETGTFRNGLVDHLVGVYRSR